ncbi:hypothetical protein V6N13_138094 [Hibiscus sabdariffa]|uniref:Thioesterase domain-containing protein n=1 Tax=Hibiscus sabdariffa TaxID=183260 RepID=A0ABR2QCH4_9ROSI
MANLSSKATVPASLDPQTSSAAATSTESDVRSKPFEPLVMDPHRPTWPRHLLRHRQTLYLQPLRGLHGGAVAAIAERVAIATARTVVGEDKEIFLVDLGMSYLSAAPKDAELIVDGSVVRSGRNITVVSVEFKMKKTGKLAFTSRATFHNSPVSNSKL